jgi:uncharacterized protein (DUF362 family)/NAD-dependent dihydropyrimidine dehydrogenase PreA subunit
MNNKVSIKKCAEYDTQKIFDIISEIYTNTGGPDVKGKKVLVKPNILSDNDPAKCVSTHPAVAEAMIRYLQLNGAEVFMGDSPAVHTAKFKADKCGLFQVCEATGAKWVNFNEKSVVKNIDGRNIKIASIVDEVDLIISLPKFKTHELVYFTGALKNTYGLIPGFAKAYQHGIYRDMDSFGKFIVELNKVVTPHYFLMDAIMGMEGQGPGTHGTPTHIGLLIGSTNPLALDIIACQIAGYDYKLLSTNEIALNEKLWLNSAEAIEYDGPALETIKKVGFKKIPASASRNTAMKFIMGRLRFLRKLERRPVFIYNRCTGCKKCVQICPVHAVKPSLSDNRRIKLTDSKCIRCFCCAEACQDNAINIKVKIFGV